MTDRKLYSDDVAEVLGIEPATWRRYCSGDADRKRQAPPADGTDIDRGHARPWWWESTIERWNSHRPGRGGRTDPAQRDAR